MSQAQRKHAGGRPSKWEPWMLRAAKFVASWGATVEEIAEGIDVAPSTVYLWMDENSEFSEAVKGAREWSDDEVVRSLRKRAIGYDHNGQHVPAHPTAQIFWLKNRKSDKWKDKTETALTGPNGGPLQTQQSDDQMIAQLVAVAGQNPMVKHKLRETLKAALAALE